MMLDKVWRFDAASRRQIARAFAAAAGVCLMAFAVGTSDDSIEAALRGTSSGSLAWGPTLFRTLLGLLGILLAFAAALPRRRSKDPSSEAPLKSASPQNVRAALAVGGLCVIGLALRLWQLDSQLWLDEILMVVSYVRRPLGEIVSTYDTQNQHILYSAAARISVSCFGESAWAIRLPAALFGVAGIGALYALGTEITNRRESLMASALLAASYHHVWFSQNARGYSGLLTATIVSSWLLLRSLRTSSMSDWRWYAAATACGAWLHITMLFVGLGHVLVCLGAWSRCRAEWRGILNGIGGAVLLAAIAYSLVLPQLLGGVLSPDYQAETTKVTLWKNPLWTIAETLRGLQLGFASWAGVGVALGVFCIGTLDYARRRAGIVLLLFAPVAAGTAALLALDHAIWPRFYLFALGFILLVAVRGAFRAVEFLPIGRELAIKVGIAACTFLVFASLWALPRAYGPKQRFADALEFVEREAAVNDLVVTLDIATFPFREYYQAPWTAASTASELAALRVGRSPTWLVYIQPVKLAAEQPELLTVIEREFEIVREFDGTLAGGTVYVARSRELSLPERSTASRRSPANGSLADAQLSVELQ